MPAGAEGIDESTWLDVIQKMDEVYSQLVADEVALEEKNAQLEQSQRFIFSLLASMSDVLLACSEDGRIEETNAALCTLVGRRDAELRGRPMAELMAGPARPDPLDATAPAERLGALTRAVQARRDALSVELELVDAQGQSVPVDFNCTARFDATGRRVGHVWVGRPMGEIKRAYRELQEAHEALKRTQQQLLHAEKMASLGRLVAGVAHELNNPISFVLANVHALQRYSERLGRYLDQVHAGAAPEALAEQRRALRIDPILKDLPSLMEGTLEGAQRTADIVQGLRRFSAMDREERQAVDLHAVIERALHWVAKASASVLTVHRDLGPPVTVSGSAGRLQQVLMNLVQNALDAATAAHPDGRPNAHDPPELWISSRVDAAHRRVEIRLRDNGPGIPQEHLPRVFDPFFTTKPVGQGTGLGLSISYAIVEQHGGELRAENAPEGGAVFVLGLPLDPA
ncbi:sensor histidine kinase [Leptothrix discophora]|uniref:histidine kinase n=1 Tax=Leptothrix discophora TaxID=89 RepID=A0ABT9G1F7_LEPDI|nr:ATP-binding protein [Leptothrix discophora]MDP4300297.1 ATP-binding protein [Leptothrix discophora]